MFFYGDTNGSDFNAKISDFDATKVCLNHYRNMLYLTFMSNNGNIVEKHQANKELDICRRKIKFWKRQNNFCDDVFTSAAEKENKKWIS